MTSGLDVARAHLKVVDLNGVLSSRQQNFPGHIAIEAMLTCDQSALGFK